MRPHPLHKDLYPGTMARHHFIQISIRVPGPTTLTYRPESRYQGPTPLHTDQYPGTRARHHYIQTRVQVPGPTTITYRPVSRYQGPTSLHTDQYPGTRARYHYIQTSIRVPGLSTITYRPVSRYQGPLPLRTDQYPGTRARSLSSVQGSSPFPFFLSSDPLPFPPRQCPKTESIASKNRRISMHRASHHYTPTIIHGPGLLNCIHRLWPRVQDSCSGR